MGDRELLLFAQQLYRNLARPLRQLMSDFGSAASKLEKEQAKRREELLKRKKQEEKQVNEAKRREKEMQDAARLRRLAEAEEELVRQAKAEEESILTGGILYCETLMVDLLDASYEDDKVLLPEAALIALTEQDALSRGVLLFELSISGPAQSTSPRKTHCGVREFSARPGAIGLPPKVVDSLTHGAPSLSASVSKVTIKYVRLPKITYIKFMPKTSTFFNVGPVKLCLEENLQKHATLTVNDVVTVWYKGVSHALRVVEMQPESRGTVIDSDIEVDLDVSEERAQREEESVAQSESKVGQVAITAAASASVATLGGEQQAPAETDEQRKARVREARLSKFTNPTLKFP